VDPKRFCPLLPDFQGMTVEDARHCLVKLSVGISYIRGTAAMKLTLAEADRPKHALYEGKGEVPGGNATLRAGFDLEAVPEGTKVKWTGQSVLMGKIASLAGGMLEPLAKKNVQKLIDGLQAALS
jgi:carbon monoxide dehydrogenase subunit G